MVSNDKANSEEKGKEKMVLKAVYFEPNIWQQAKRKAGLMPLAAVIRRLVQLWLEGKINLENYKD